MSKEVNGVYADYDRQWLETVAGKRRGEIHEWDNLLSNAMANRILDRIAELEDNFNSSKELFALIPKDRRELLERITELEAIIYRLVDPCMATEDEEKIILEISQRQEVDDGHR